MSETWRAFAKVNLDLRILGKRADGYHEIRSVLQTIDLCDEIRVSEADMFRFTATAGPEDESNLVVRAVRAFEAATSTKVGLHLHLEKRIPSGAGLGGGSADAAVTVLGLIRLYSMHISGDRLIRLLGTLGSDVPFFALGGRVLATGRGEVLFPLADRGDPQSTCFLLVHPGFKIGTTAAYSWLTETFEAITILGFCARFLPQLGSAEPAPNARLNDFEAPLFRRFPDLAEIKGKLSASGARRAALSGSGATLFGEFASEGDATRAVGLLERDYDVTLVRPLSRIDYLRRMFEG
jgi:4-diphosphocytidyl-2-C-methyl-D-erythritol kinase